MTREKEFRGYDTESKCWRYGYYFLKEDITLCAMYDSKEHWQQDREKNEHHLIIWNGFSDWNLPKPHYQSEVDGKSIGQFTGMYDKNKKRIYEGDIVSAWSEGSHAIGEVIHRIDGLWIMFPAYQNQNFWGLCPNDNGETTVEIIGNAYENAELLEEE